MVMLHYRGVPIANATRWQRACMEMAKYPARAQRQMHVAPGFLPCLETLT